MTSHFLPRDMLTNLTSAWLGPGDLRHLAICYDMKRGWISASLNDWSMFHGVSWCFMMFPYISIMLADFSNDQPYRVIQLSMLPHQICGHVAVIHPSGGEIPTWLRSGTQTTKPQRIKQLNGKVVFRLEYDKLFINIVEQSIWYPTNPNHIQQYLTCNMNQYDSPP